MIQKILIANRSEIARRIIHAAQEMSIPTVAIYSDPDKESLHVKEADESYSLEGTEAADSYLRIDKIIKIAKISKADAIHPGYGFLSENPVFAEECEKNGITFIGPSSSVIRKLGSKIESKKIAKQVGVPTVPSLEVTSTEKVFLEELASQVGYPILVKAAAGGGGKGMKVVRHPSELEETVQSAAREAIAFFNDSTLFFEKYLESPRHIEVQLLGDQHGNLVHLFERECSVQRRHQKMIEEAPSPSIDPELRKKICESAVKIAKAAGYFSTGTAEFIVDSNDQFYFLEVNTRLQVEHPVTEAITGIDLVKAQIQIASGKKLPFTQEEIQTRGHAIECRLYAEDPENDFLPAAGEVGVLHEPKRPGVRIDSALQSGHKILPFYDPMLAKLIVSGRDRKEAIEKIDALLRDYTLLGIRHNLDFLRFFVQSDCFQKGRYHTQTVQELIPLFKKAREEVPALTFLIGLLGSKSKVENKTENRAAQSPALLFSEKVSGFRNI